MPEAGGFGQWGAGVAMRLQEGQGLTFLSSFVRSFFCAFGGGSETDPGDDDDDAICDLRLATWSAFHRRSPTVTFFVFERDS
jgi:hypothetical protein